MKEDRRRFLRVFGASAVSIALPACGSSTDTQESTPGGAGGSTSASTGPSSTASSSHASSSSASSSSQASSSSATNAVASSSSATNAVASSSSATNAVASSSSASTGGAGGAGGASGGAGGAGPCTEPKGVDVGMPSAFASNGLFGVPGSMVLIGRDAGGIYALTSICTHQGCNLNTDGNVQPTGVSCGCHGSSFAADGSVVNGPAQAPLRHLAVALGCNGDLVVDSSTTAPNAVRLKV